MNELKTAAAPWKCDYKSVLDVEHQTNPKIKGNIELVEDETKPPQNLVWTPASNMKLFQSSHWKPLWMHSNQYLVTYCEFMQPLVRLGSRLIIKIVDCHLHCIMIMQLIQMWCRWLVTMMEYLGEEGECRGYS